MAYTNEQLYALSGDFQAARIVASVRHGLAHVVRESDPGGDESDRSKSEPGRVTTDLNTIDNIELGLDNLNRPMGLVSMVAFLRMSAPVHGRQDMDYKVRLMRTPHEDHLAHYTTPLAFGRAYFWLAVHVLPNVGALNGGAVVFSGHSTSQDRRVTCLKFHDALDLSCLTFMERELTGVMDASSFIVVDPVARTITVSVEDEPRLTRTAQMASTT